jgi:hypothetical protein
MQERKRLSDILPRADRKNLDRLWAETEAADDLGPLPAGTYSCRIADGVLFTAKSGTPGFKLTFEVIDGDHAGRRIWHDVWLTPAAMSMAKRDLSKIGITHPDQLEEPLPRGILATVKLALRRDDDGTQRNRVQSFQVTGVEATEPEPFAPNDDPNDDGGYDRRGNQGTDNR